MGESFIAYHMGNFDLKAKISSVFANFKNKDSKLKNKYTITIVCFLVWISFFDENCIMSDIRYKNEIRQLQQKIETYKADIALSIKKSNELRTNNENLEKFAREQYKMKKAKEDIFIIQ